MAKKYKDIDDYISDFSGEPAKRLEQIRRTIQKAAPRAIETISYNMPAFRMRINLVYFAAYKNHIGLYALPLSNQVFKKELSAYKTSKGAVQFQHHEKLPLELIRKMVEFRVRSVEAE